MATLFEYKCKDCGYTVNANPKGHDMIMSGDLYTYLCEDCKEIVDVVYPYGEKPEKIICPECSLETNIICIANTLLLTCNTPSEADLSIAEEVNVLQERLILDLPCEGC